MVTEIKFTEDGHLTQTNLELWCALPLFIEMLGS